MKKAKIFAIAAIAAMGLSSCVKETTEGPDYQAEGSGISFTFNKPVGAYVQTYADIASAAEWAINTLDVYAFKSDGTFAGKLTSSDYDSSVSDHTTTITMTQGWVNTNIGGTFRFYFVANDASSTNGEHIPTAFSGNEDAFKALVTKELTDAGGDGKFDNIVTPLLFSGASTAVNVTAAKISQTVDIKRRVARFDVVNDVPAKLVIKEVRISDARQQGYIWSDAGVGADITTFAQVSMESVDLTTKTAVNDTYESAFYLYPTSLDQTTLMIVAELNGGVAKMYEVTSSTAIEANKRYKLVCTGDPAIGDVEFIVEAQDWDDDDDSIDVDVNTPKEEAGVTMLEPVSSTSNIYSSGIFYVDDNAGAAVSISLTSTHGTYAKVSFIGGVGSTLNYDSELSSATVEGSKTSIVTYGEFKTTDTYTFNLPKTEDNGAFDIEIRFISKGNEYKYQNVRLIRMAASSLIGTVANPGVRNILYYDSTEGYGLNLEGIGIPLYFKYGSLIGINASEDVTNDFNVEDIIYAPDGYILDDLKTAINSTSTSSEAWGKIPYISNTAFMPIPEGQVVSGIGDPCKFASTGVAGKGVGDFKMPDGNSYNGYMSGTGIWGESNGIIGREINGQFYPAIGYRHATTGIVSYVGRLGYFWSATPYSTIASAAYSMYVNNSNVFPKSYHNNAYGLAVRCVPAE